MRITILKIIWPYLQRYLTQRAARYTAAYLQARREQRVQQAEQESGEALLFEEPESSQAADVPVSPPVQSFLAGNTFWYGMAGILLGSAFGVIVTLIRRED